MTTSTPSRREHCDHNAAGCVQRHRNRQTGTLIGVYQAEQAQIDAGGPWATVCETHGVIAGHPTLAIARSHAANPTGWCGACGAALSTANPSLHARGFEASFS